jgi:hypothetical protein
LHLISFLPTNHSTEWLRDVYYAYPTLNKFPLSIRYELVQSCTKLAVEPFTIVIGRPQALVSLPLSCDFLFFFATPTPISRNKYYFIKILPINALYQFSKKLHRIKCLGFFTVLADYSMQAHIDSVLPFSNLTEMNLVIVFSTDLNVSRK